MPVGLDWAESMMSLLLHVTCSCIHTFIFVYYDIDLFGTFLFIPLSLSLFLSFFLFLLLIALWHLSENLLCPGTLFIPRHFLLILLHLMSSSMMIKLIRTFRRTFHDATFIRNARSFYRIFLILTFPLSSTVGIVSHCVASRSLALP